MGAGSRGGWSVTEVGIDRERERERERGERKRENTREVDEREK